MKIQDKKEKKAKKAPKAGKAGGSGKKSAKAVEDSTPQGDDVATSGTTGAEPTTNGTASVVKRTHAAPRVEEVEGE